MKRRKLILRISNHRKSFKMNLLDESVIVCDTPKINKSSKKMNGSVQKNLSSPVRRQTRSQRKPLYPVHMSPVNRKNMCSSKTPQSVTKKKRLHEVEILSSRKRQKTCINETIVISDDDDNNNDNDNKNNDKSHESQMTHKLKDTPEVIVIDNFTPNVNNKRLRPRNSNVNNQEIKRKKKIEDKIKERKKLRKIQNMERTRNRARKNIEVSKKQNEDVAVIWSSAKDDNTALENNQKISTKSNYETPQLFFVDTKGDNSICEKMALPPQSEILYTANKFTKFDTAPTTSTATSTTTNTNNTVTSEQAKSNTSDDQNNKQIHKLREIIVDGLNVAFGYSLGRKIFEKNGLQLVLDYFQDRGHKVKIFLPQNQRNRYRGFLEQWYREGLVIFTPSRNIGGKKIVPYDDRFILDYATKCKGIVVSSDQYRDLWHEKPEWRETIEKRLLAPTFAGEYVMFPEDPLGRGGPSLNEFLKH
ncbi:GSCOCG00010008001-RA-CDS [Cotesia congregata]|uniref:Similar to ZC3H12C: Probable ribonuclease ZC3H12C (Homo sapiens) n=1 Tax=Cotesia congregata TaxID=51543 RepID=A0A8J2HBX1_COTCN|nr:GSCOCG00010008001-RA-CDS [Cotesia congregata]CAG5089211.1 Similar to ZC3H12C: Probable ribonuclease ZC3H12C (Homo sapiens) [Cotesia congregata]